MNNNLISFPYRSPHKLSSSGIQHNDSFRVPKIVKKTQRKLNLHHIHGNKTWMTDHMEIEQNGNKLIILNFIHCNSRYWLARIVPTKDAKNAADILMFLVQAEPFTAYEYPLINTLISDDAQGLNKSKIITSICRAQHIQQITYNMTNIPHTYLSIIDRISRTLRYMIFNCKRKNPQWELNDDSLTDILSIYNNTPHDTLSKTMGFNVSPTQALIHKNLQDALVRKWTVQNYNLTNSWEFTYIQPGMFVYLAQKKSRLNNDKPRNTVEDIPYKVLECKRGSYKIQQVLKGTHEIDISKQPINVQRKDFVVGSPP